MPTGSPGAIDVVGISNFVTFLENTESYRRDLRRAEYGDERDPEMRAFLSSISPLTNAAKITQAAVRGAGQERPARARDRSRADRARGARDGGGSGTCWPRTRATASAARRTPTTSSMRSVMFMRETLLR